MPWYPEAEKLRVRLSVEKLFPLEPGFKARLGDAAGKEKGNAAAGSQKMALVVCRWSSSLSMATAGEPINSPGQAVRRPDLSTRNSETVEVSQKLIFLKWEKDEARPFF